MHVNGWPLGYLPAYDAPTYAHDQQVHPGEVVYSSLHFHLEQGAEMGAEYTFYVRNFVHQWNEEGTP